MGNDKEVFPGGFFLIFNRGGGRGWVEIFHKKGELHKKVVEEKYR